MRASFLPSRKYFNESYYYLDESPSTPAPSIVPDWDADDTNGNNDSSNSATSTSIPAHLYIQRVASLHAEGDIGFSKEFEAVHAMTTQKDLAASTSKLPDNQGKNRYPNVVACELYSLFFVLRHKKGCRRLSRVSHASTIHVCPRFFLFQTITPESSSDPSPARSRASTSTPTTSTASRRPEPTSLPRDRFPRRSTPSGGWSGSRGSEQWS